MKIKFSNLPEVVKSALSENMDISGLAESEIELPAYPFKISELISKLDSEEKIEIGAFRVSPSSISSGIKIVTITEKEYNIIKYLLKESKASRESLLENVWGYSADADTNTVETHIYRLRHKIMESFGKELITSYNGVYSISA